MNISERHKKLIEKYLDDNLNTDQTTEFNEAIKSDVFREQLLFQARLVDTSKAIGRDMLRKELNQLANKKIKQKTGKRNIYILIGAIGLFLCILLGIKLLQPNSSMDHLFAKYFVEIPPDVSKRGIENEFTLGYQEAMQLYIEHDYQKALNAFENLPGSSDNLTLYKAMCQIQLDNHQMAKQKLLPLLKSIEKGVIENAEWYLALIYIHEGNLKMAHESLNQIIQSEGHLYSGLAGKLKKDLED